MRDDARPLPANDLDWWEGVSMWFLKTLFSVFKKANAVDPTFPKLDAASLRSSLSPNATRKPKAVAPAPAPSPVA